MNLTPDSIPSIPPLLFRETDRGWIVMNPDKPRYALINPIGYEILSRSVKGLKIKDIADEIAREYEAPADEVLTDVLTFLEGFMKSGLADDTPSNWSLEQVEPGFYFEVTRRCNYNCDYCYAGADNNVKDPLDTAGVKKIIARMKEAGGSFIIISGGEPLMRKDIFEILEAALEAAPVNLITNAALIDESKAARLAAMKNLTIRISIDGAEKKFHDPHRGEGTFDKTMKGIRNLIDAGMADRLSLCPTISSLNVEGIPAMFEFTAKLGIPSLILTPVARSGRAAELWEKMKPGPEDMYKLLREVDSLKDEYADRLNVSGSIGSALKNSLMSHKPNVKCPIGFRPALDPEGNVYPCSLMMEKHFHCGNLLEQPFIEILQGEGMTKFSEAALKRKDRVEKCSACFYRGYCCSGCMARAWQEGGELYTPDPDCDVLLKLLDDYAGNI